MSDTPPPGPAAAPAPTSLASLILVLGACGFASTFTMRIIDPLIPTLAGEFERSVPQIVMMVTGFSLAYALGQPFLGPVADAIGKIRTILTCLIALALFSTVAALSQSYEIMTAVRAITGIAAGGIIPIAMAAIGDRAPMQERQIALGRFLVLMIIGQMSGSACSGLIATHAGWRAAFLSAAVVSVLAAVLVALVLKPRRNVTRARLSVGGALANYRIVFANPRTRLLYGLVVIEGILLFGIPAYVAAILFERSGVGPAEAGLVIAGMGFGCLVYGLMTRILVERLGPTLMTRLGGVVCAIGLSLFAFDWVWWSAIPLFALQGFGFFLLHGTFQAQATELAPAARGSAMALFACCFFLGQATGPLAMGAAMSVVGTPLAILAFAIAIALFGYLTPRILPVPRSRT
ncbi:MAG TPA: MFS transporter [Bosea sp. (in: a-proteobacteria)]|jgi:predicted MFS family arabinose efflux permease|uniref:MFS transporter n=1 Tax=Bosea sp. (in: a-proteobacteria) TaxID=1871050 RepID=UPI002DDD4073|nr:MFS transporter [Bosea sp. (in: a-proteobacteria)]HEV2556121.1 MFS transporter [Bosea sp. (in: a-proteobacteria)]